MCWLHQQISGVVVSVWLCEWCEYGKVFRQQVRECGLL